MALTDKLSAIGNAIREKTGESGTMKLDQMPEKIRSISDKEDIEWHQCPQIVNEYIAFVKSNHYSEDDSSTTYIQNKNGVTGAEASVDFATWTAPSLSDVEDHTKPIGYTVDGQTYYDNVPNIPEPFATQNTAGTLTALDKLRWYRTTYKAKQVGVNPKYELGCNCRDLGGWGCNGGTIKYGLMVRSGDINPVDKELMVGTIGIKTEVCMLPVEDQQFVGRSAWGIDYVGNWTNDDIMYTIADTATYRDQWKLYLGTIIRSVNAGKPVIFHCGAGADKTGTVALVVLGLLGVALEDIDIDFELTAFFKGVYGGLTGGRTRAYTRYVGLKQQIKNFSLVGGLSDTFENRCISFALSLGITVDEVNTFRAACINGTPDIINPSLSEYTITKNGQGVLYSNPDTSVTQYQAYQTEIVPTGTNVITDISVMMDGVDITDKCFDGKKIPYGTEIIANNGTFDVSWKAFVEANVSGGENFLVTKTLGNSTSNNSQETIIVGQSYGAKITANIGHEIDSVSVIVNNVDMTDSCVTLIE